MKKSITNNGCNVIPPVQSKIATFPSLCCGHNGGYHRSVFKLNSSFALNFIQYGAFTLAEIMVALVVIGIITSIILPVAYNNLPNEKIMKFKKGNATLAKVINELVSSGEYYTYGDLGTDNNGNGVSATYFCETFSELVTVKKVNCQNTKNDNTNIGMFRLSGMGQDVLSDDTTSAYKYVDSMCKTYHPKDENDKDAFDIITSDNVKFYIINPATTFSTKVQDGSYDMFSPCLQTYKIMCMQVEDEIFGYGIRKDGRIMAGERAVKWSSYSIQTKEDDIIDDKIENIGLVSVAFSATDGAKALKCKTKPYENSVSGSGGGSYGSGEETGSGGESGSGGSGSGGSMSGGNDDLNTGSEGSSTSYNNGVTTTTYTDDVGNKYEYTNCSNADSNGCNKCTIAGMSSGMVTKYIANGALSYTVKGCGFELSKPDGSDCATVCQAKSCTYFLGSTSKNVCYCSKCEETYSKSVAVVDNVTTLTITNSLGEKTNYYNCLEGGTSGCTKCSSSEFQIGKVGTDNTKSCLFYMLAGDTTSVGSDAKTYCTDLCNAARCEYSTYSVDATNNSYTVKNCICNKCDESFTDR